MSRYIDADAMKEWLDEYLSVFKKYDKSEVKGFVEHQPSIDIVRCKECKHREEYPCKVYHDGDWFCADGEREGEWIEGKYDLMCSNCENTQEYEKFPYCPYCGAKMDGERKESK